MHSELSSNQIKNKLNVEDVHYINIMRGFSILRVVLVHLGLSWFFPPYSQYIGIFLPVLFFVSGAVSYFSFLRAGSVGEYLIKRLVLIVVPFYVFAAFVLLITAFFYPEKFPDGQGVLYWLMVWPEFSEVFFPLNQVWFINSLIVMIFLSGPIFYFSRNKPYVLWSIVVLSFLISILNIPYDLYEAVRNFPIFVDMRWGHQAWQTLILFGIFVYGAIHYRYFSDCHGKYLALAAVTFLILAALSYLYVALGFDLKEHTQHRSPYYLFLSFVAIFFLLAMQGPALFLLARLKVLEWIILYTNRYAYSVYLLHTLVLFYIEEWLDLSDLGDKPALALVRMLLVVIVTLIIAKPLGDFSRYLAHLTREKLLGASKRPSIS